MPRRIAFTISRRTTRCGIRFPATMIKCGSHIHLAGAGCSDRDATRGLTTRERPAIVVTGSPGRPRTVPEWVARCGLGLEFLMVQVDWRSVVLVCARNDLPYFGWDELGLESMQVCMYLVKKAKNCLL